MTDTIRRIYIRRYRGSNTVIAYCEWQDGSRTEAHPAFFFERRLKRWRITFGSHMHALFARAKREGLSMQRETW